MHSCNSPLQILFMPVSKQPISPFSSVSLMRDFKSVVLCLLQVVSAWVLHTWLLPVWVLNEHCLWCVVVVWRWWLERWTVVETSCQFHVVTTRSSSWKETETSSGCPTAPRGSLTVGTAVRHQYHLFLILQLMLLIWLQWQCEFFSSNTAANVKNEQNLQ